MEDKIRYVYKLIESKIEFIDLLRYLLINRESFDRDSILLIYIKYKIMTEKELRRKEVYDYLYDGIENCWSITSIIKQIYYHLDILDDKDVQRILRYYFTFK